MENMSFKQFIYTFNFRYYDDSKRGENNKEDTLIIRIHYSFDDDDIIDDDCWFEFGVYDFGSKDITWEYCCRFLNQKILNSYITCIRFDAEENNVVNIWVTKEKDFIN